MHVLKIDQFFRPIARNGEPVNVPVGNPSLSSLHINILGIPVPACAVPPSGVKPEGSIESGLPVEMKLADRFSFLEVQVVFRSDGPEIHPAGIDRKSTRLKYSH